MTWQWNHFEELVETAREKWVCETRLVLGAETEWVTRGYKFRILEFCPVLFSPRPFSALCSRCSAQWRRGISFYLCTSSWPAIIMWCHHKNRIYIWPVYIGTPRKKQHLCSCVRLLACAYLAMYVYIYSPSLLCARSRVEFRPLKKRKARNAALCKLNCVCTLL